MGTEERTDYRKSTPEVLYQMRKTVIALFKKEKSVEEIIEVTDFSERTVRETIRKYKSGGMAALKPKKRGRKAGEKRTLTPNQEKEVVRNITDKNPDQLKMKCALWTRDAVRQLSHDHQFNWWFGDAPERGGLLAPPKGGVESTILAASQGGYFSVLLSL